MLLLVLIGLNGLSRCLCSVLLFASSYFQSKKVHSTPGAEKRSTSIPLLPFIHKKRNETLERNSRSPGMKLFNKQLWIFEFIAHHQIRSLADVSFSRIKLESFWRKINSKICERNLICVQSPANCYKPFFKKPKSKYLQWEREGKQNTALSLLWTIWLNFITMLSNANTNVYSNS